MLPYRKACGLPNKIIRIKPVIKVYYDVILNNFNDRGRAVYIKKHTMP